MSLNNVQDTNKQHGYFYIKNFFRSPDVKGTKLSIQGIKKTIIMSSIINGVVLNPTVTLTMKLQIKMRPFDAYSLL